MAANTYVALSTQTVGTAVSTVTFSSIPSGYTDLVMVVNGGLTTANQSFRFQVGSGTIDTGNNYSYTYIAGNGSSASSSRATNTSGFNAYHVSGQSDANIKNNVILHFQNYSNATTYKTILNRGNSDLETAATVALWRNTAAINTILVGTTNGNLAAGTTISLYGVAAASVGAKATGGAIYQDATYFYHVFSGNGTFTPSQALTADILVVAGGGGGGINYAGGGGAGGLLGFTSQSLASGTGYTCTVGAGGAKSTSAGVRGSNGVNSQFGSLTPASVGGGGAGAAEGSSQKTGASGGSGGGGAGADGTQSYTGTNAGGTATSGQGTAGGIGKGINGQGSAGGGGGGASVPGFDAVVSGSATAGAGGNGSTAYNSWSQVTGIGQNVSGTYYIAGGGGGGAYSGTAAVGGYGGGAAGTTNGTAINATDNTGGGGGGTGNGVASNGGSGVIIVRYAK